MTLATADKRAKALRRAAGPPIAPRENLAPSRPDKRRPAEPTNPPRRKAKEQIARPAVERSQSSRPAGDAAAAETPLDEAHPDYWKQRVRCEFCWRMVARGGLEEHQNNSEFCKDWQIRQSGKKTPTVVTTWRCCMRADVSKRAGLVAASLLGCVLTFDKSSACIDM